MPGSAKNQGYRRARKANAALLLTTLEPGFNHKKGLTPEAPSRPSLFEEDYPRRRGQIINPTPAIRLQARPFRLPYHSAGIAQANNSDHAYRLSRHSPRPYSCTPQQTT